MLGPRVCAGRRPSTSKSTGAWKPLFLCLFEGAAERGGECPNIGLREYARVVAGDRMHVDRLAADGAPAEVRFVRPEQWLCMRAEDCGASAFPARPILDVGDVVQFVTYTYRPLLPQLRRRRRGSAAFVEVSGDEGHRLCPQPPSHARVCGREGHHHCWRRWRRQAMPLAGGGQDHVGSRYASVSLPSSSTGTWTTSRVGGGLSCRGGLRPRWSRIRVSPRVRQGGRVRSAAALRP
jgi:hypothetical protein